MFKCKRDRFVHEQYEEVIDKLQKEVADLRFKFENDVANSDVEVDFAAMKAFSVERLIKDNEAATSIGYVDPNNNIREWFLYVSNTTHQRLVDEFREFKFNKYNEVSDED